MSAEIRHFEIRCFGGRHLLGQLRMPADFCEPGKPAVLVSVKDARCNGQQVEASCVSAAPLASDTDNPWKQGVWRRQRGIAFQVRCPNGTHLLAHVFVPTAFLKDATRAIEFYTECHTCNVPVETALVALSEVRAGAPPRGQPGVLEECGRTR